MTTQHPQVGNNLPGERSGRLQLMALACEWTKAMKGMVEITPLLNGLLEIADAQAVVLSRFEPATGRRRTISLADPVGTGRIGRPLVKGLSGEILGRHLSNIKSGVAVYLSEMRREPDFEISPATDRLLGDRGTREVMSIILASGNIVDVLEIHLPAKLEKLDNDRLQAFAACAVAQWQDRTTGLIQNILNAHQESHGSLGEYDGAPILDISNPSGLSRAEFGVCLLIRRGYTAARISDELNVAKSTVKTHLRNIYAKTGAHGQVDLMYRLLNEPDPQDSKAVA